MFFNGVTVVVLWLKLLAKVETVFYMQVDGGRILDSDNNERAGMENIPQLKAKLYECVNEAIEDGWRMSDCRAVSSRSCIKRCHIFNSFNFYTTFEPELDIGHIIRFDEKDIQIPPKIMAVGFNPLAIDSPRFDAYPVSREKIYDAVCDLRDGMYDIYMDVDEEFVQNMVDYLSCNDIFTCFMADPHRARDVFLPMVRKTLLFVIAAHEANFKAEQRASSQSSATERDKRRKRDDLEVKKTMKLMLEKLIDPCILHANAPDEVERNCLVYCKFLSAVHEAFDSNINSSCKSLKSGTCSEGVCFCSKRIEQPQRSSPWPFRSSTKSSSSKLKSAPKFGLLCNRMVKMLYCDNMLRQSLSSFLSPINYNFLTRKKYKSTKLHRYSPSDFPFWAPYSDQARYLVEYGNTLSPSPSPSPMRSPNQNESSPKLKDTLRPYANRQSPNGNRLSPNVSGPSPNRNGLGSIRNGPSANGNGPIGNSPSQSKRGSIQNVKGPSLEIRDLWTK